MADIASESYRVLRIKMRKALTFQKFYFL